MKPPRAGRLVYTLNALTLLLAEQDATYRRVLLRGDWLLADGVGAAWAVRRLTGVTARRLAGIDFVDTLSAACARDGSPVYLLGGRAGVAERAARALQARHHGLRVAGCRTGFWRPDEETDVVEGIARSGARVLLAGLGQPAQEIFLDRYRQRLGMHAAVGVGGSFDVLCGDLARAPRLLRVGGLEWLFRLLQEPARWRRMAALPRFAWRTVRRRPITSARTDACNEY